MVRVELRRVRCHGMNSDVLGVNLVEVGRIGASLGEVGYSRVGWVRES